MQNPKFRLIHELAYKRSLGIVNTVTIKSYSYYGLMIFLIILTAQANAIASYRCEQNGKILYQTFPCSNTTSLPSQLQHATKQQDLIYFCKQGKEQQAYQLLANGTSANSCDQAQNSALFYALTGKYYSLARLLIAANADCNASIANGNTLLMHFAAQNDKQALQILLNAQANNNSINPQTGDTALTLAVSAGQAANVQLLLTAGADPNIFNYQGLTPLIIALDKASNDIVQLLIANRAAVDLFSRKLNTKVSITPAIHFATLGATKQLKQLLKFGANINLANEHKITPLTAAALAGNLTTIKFLLNSGADPYQLLAAPDLWNYIKLKQDPKVADLITAALY